MFKFDKHKTDTMSVENLSLPAFPTFDLLKKTRWKRDGPNTWDVLILCARLLVLPMMANVYRGWNVWNLQKYHYCGGNYTCTSQCSFRDTLSTDFQSCLQMLPFPLIKTATRRNNSWILYTFEGASSEMWICGPHSRN